MCNFSYNPLANVLKISYVWPKCSKKNNEYIDVPFPDLTAETDRESVSTDTSNIQCESCGKEFSVELATGYNGGVGNIHGVKKIISIEEGFPAVGEYDN